MNYRNRLSVSPLLLAILASFAASANEPAQDPLLSISEVIVVNGEKPSAVQQSTTHWQVTAEEIRESGAVSLDQVLKNVPGLYVRVGGVGTPRVDIRGLKTRHVVYLVNGVPASNANDGQFDPSVIPTSQIAVVEVSVGPTSVLYGPGGAGGVINIITKTATSAPSLSGKLEGSENDILNGDISVSSSGEQWQSLLSLSHQQTDGFPMSDDYLRQTYQMSDTRENADKEVQTLYGQGSYHIDENSVLTANVSLKQGEWGKPSRDGSTDSKSKFERVDDYDEQTLQLGGAHRFDSNMTLRGFAYYNQNSVVEQSFDDENYAKVKSQQDGRSKIQGANIQAIMNMSDESLFTSSVIAENQSWRAVTTNSKSSTRSFDELWLYTLATEYQFQAPTDYGATLGAAYHYLDKNDGNDSDFSAQASVYWWLNDSSKWTAGFAHKVRYPSMRNLYSQSSGNTELVPEKSNHLELSLAQQLGYNTEIVIAGHHSQADDYIAKDSDSIYQNLGDYRFQGIDLALNSMYWDGLKLNLSYSYLDTLDKDAESAFSTLEYRPRHQVRLQASYDFVTGTQLSINAERIMGQIFYSQQKVGKEKILQQAELEDYTLVDINLSQEIYQDHVSLYLRATNLLDESYYQSEALPRAGRQVFVGVNWQL